MRLTLPKTRNATTIATCQYKAPETLRPFLRAATTSVISWKKKIPAVANLTRDIRSRRTSKKQRVADVAAYLVRHAADLAKFSGVEDFVTTSNPLPNQSIIERHLLQIRSYLARELWSRELFIGVSVLDDLLFSGIAVTAPVE